MTKINRRTTIAAAAAAAAALLLTGLMPTLANAKTLNFSESTYEKLLKSGKPFLLSVHTEWCTTCAAQKRVLGSLRGKGQPYSDLTELAMDWDKYRGSKIAKKLRIPRRSVLIMYGDGKEAGRIIAGTGSAQIKTLIDKGLN